MLKAINTRYKGHYFRSRLEARWAMFLDIMEVEWCYEHEGYDLGDGIRYLPDFWFPKLQIFGEVKPTSTLSDQEEEKCLRLCQQSEKMVVLMDGLPNVAPLDYWDYGEKFGGPGVSVLPFVVPNKVLMCWEPPKTDYSVYEPMRTAIRKSHEARFNR